jgi:hypothetical protein
MFTSKFEGSRDFESPRALVLDAYKSSKDLAFEDEDIPEYGPFEG